MKEELFYVFPGCLFIVYLILLQPLKAMGEGQLCSAAFCSGKVEQFFNPTLANNVAFDDSWPSYGDERMSHY